jgi:hypothetical protein
LPTVEERLEQLERQQGKQTKTLKQIVEGDWTGAEGAAGTIDELMGGNSGIQPREFPEVKP